MEKEADQQVRHYRDQLAQKYRGMYIEKKKKVKEEIRNQLLGEYILLTAFILHDKFDCDVEGMKLYVMELMRLADDIENDEAFNEGVAEADQLTLANIVTSLDAEGFGLTEVLEDVEAKLQREKAYRKFPYVYEHKGWTDEDDAILKGMIIYEFDYPTIAKKLVKTEKAVKARAYKLWNTSIQDTIRQKLKESKVA